ncbi:hypothetical protein HHK36_030136 [Tetracentron sinense]|uniref:Glycosyltransferase n=1 Tax=Tetracentron sinense TaxID=13715 RepID=A0A835D008_TETSI|nr:hypothetical protein HHK36_030136 [Tetracentron sinense]
MGNPHAVVIAYPVQGHVIPLMEFSHCLADCGVKITFVNTHSNHSRMMNSLQEKSNKQIQIDLVSLPDGIAEGEDRNLVPEKLYDSIIKTMPGYLEKLITKINKSFKDKITCIIADENMAWAVQVAKKMGIPSAVFWPASASLRALLLHIPKLIEEGIIDANGIPSKHQMIKLSPTMPAMNTAHFAWRCFDGKLQEIIFHGMYSNNQAVKDADWLLCNSFYDIEPSAYASSNLLPVGPMLPGTRPGQPVGHLWPEDSTCLQWLDQQPNCSVVYVAFGSFTVFEQSQFHELALGLELSGHPFLWVVRPDLTKAPDANYPDGFQTRIAARGQMVGWAPQQKVLAHPSIACFLTHCGWNSTMEGLRMGVPFLCWPYFADQFLNQAYISDVWKVGLQLNPDHKGIISRDEIKKKVDELLGDEKIKERSLDLKEKAKISVHEGGSSNKNFKNFVEALKGMS